MREKLNENPIAQVAVVAVLLVVAGFMLLSKMGGGEEESAAPAETMVSTSAGTTSGVEAAPEQSVTAGIPSGVPVPPLPRPVAAAYKAGKTVVVLVVHDGGIDDRLAKRAVRVLRPLSEVAVFVVPASEIARYAAIAIGVDVNRVPALIVMRPRRVSEGTPQAAVTYGLQTPRSIVQAVRDAAYAGPTVPYHPE